MKKILRLPVFMAFSVMLTACSSSKKLAEPQLAVHPLSDSNVPTEGSIVYGLPRTVLTFTVEFERTIEKPGPYARYASELLGLDNVIISENESWAINGISVKSHEELDPSEFYIIESNTLFQTNVLAIKKEGLILDLNPELFPSYGNIQNSSGQDINQLSTLDLGSDEYYMVQSDTAYKRLTIDSSFVRVPYVVEKKRRLSTDQLAERAAKRLMEMREGKHLILTGEATVYPQSSAAIDEINRLEKEYMELFTGKTIKQKLVYTYNYIPVKDADNKPKVLFQFSDVMGPVTGTGKGGTPVTLELIPEQKTKDLTILKKQGPESIQQEYDKIYYRVPDIVSLKISQGSDVLLTGRKMIYQFGQMVQLPANFIIGK